MSSIRIAQRAAAVLTMAVCATGELAQQRPPYAAAISLETAKKVAAVSAAEAKTDNWNVAISIVDNHGLLVF